MKSLIVILITTICFAKSQIPLDSKGAEKYFTKKEMENASMWKLYVSGPPLMKFYLDKDLKGKAIAEVRKEGLFLNDKRVCHFEKVYGGLNMLIDDVVDGKSAGPLSSTYDEYSKKKALCFFFPLMKDEDSDSGSEGTSYVTEVIVRDGKVAEFNYRKNKYYFDIGDLMRGASYRIEKDTEGQLQEDLSDDEMIKLNKAVLEFREMLDKKTAEEIHEMLLKRHPPIKLERHHNAIFCTPDKQEYLERMKKPNTIKILKRLTFLKYVDFRGTGIDRVSKLKLLEFEDQGVYISYNLDSEKWYVVRTQLCGLGKIIN